jgi:CRISPR-associated protein Cmr1
VGSRYRPPRKTPEWSDVVWGDDDRFPLGALGLPVNYKDGYAVNAEHRGEQLRRASPLWLRPVGDATGWRLLSFAFLGAFLPGPDAPSVRLRGRTNARTLRVSDDDVALLADAWIKRLAEPEWTWFAHGERPAPPA